MDKREAKNKRLKAKYGISIEEYEELLKNQNYSCAICKKPQTHFKRALAVDHCHASLVVRGLLCFYCNKRVVGRHNKTSVKKLVEYLLPDMMLVEKL